MSSRLRAPGGSKLARPVPVGSGLKAPGGKPANRPSPQPAGVGGGYDREGPPMARTTPVGGQRKPVSQVHGYIIYIQPTEITPLESKYMYTAIYLLVLKSIHVILDL